MSPEAQRIAIAEACPGVIHCVLGRWRYRDSENWWEDCLDNDPLTDLNAMKEAENTLNDEQVEEYDRILIALCGADAFRAKSEKRAEAFLRVKGLWKSDKS